jgi:uncharacterized membrane protein YgcG
MIRGAFRALGAGCAALAVALVTTVVPAPANAIRASTFVGLSTFAGTYVIQPDGTVQATEVLTAQFTGTDSHGIYRTITNEQAYEPKAHTKRVYGISNIRVTGDPGIPTDLSTRQTGADFEIRVGNASRTIPAGTHTYTLKYDIANALNHFDDHDEFYWNVTGNKWNRINAVTVTQRGPAPFTETLCFAGAYGSTRPCASSTIQPDGSARFTNGPLVFAGITTVVALPPGIISPVPTPALVDTRFNAAKTLRISVVSAILAGLELIVLVGAVVAFVVIRGRDRQAAGSAVDQAYATANPDAPEPRVPMFAGREIPVEFIPPEKLRPGLLGALVHEQVTPLDITATIVDLATRGYIRIVELEPTGAIFKHADWRLDRMRQDTDGLESYEVELLTRVFAGGANSLALSSLQNTFAADMSAIKKSLLAAILARRWFRSDPAKARNSARALGMFTLLAGFAGFGFFDAAVSLSPLFCIPPIIAGALLVILARYVPARTALGTATYRHALGFRRFITESEKYRAQFAERENLFTEYLAYAVVFGATSKWAQTFKDLGLAQPDTSSWYYSAHPFDVVVFGSALNSFAVTSAGTLTSTPGGSGDSGFGGGGFSGGGGGGGGGGGW